MSKLFNQKNFPENTKPEEKFQDISTQELLSKIKLLNETRDNLDRNPKPETKHKISKISQLLLDVLMRKGLEK